ncbi:MAG: helix-turn-helix domain-containing protein [Polyangiaceae bacterium]|nr:helix-turn-helix domain-containing protein [Polyangiaceae bacterium]
MSAAPKLARRLAPKRLGPTPAVGSDLRARVRAALAGLGARRPQTIDLAVSQPSRVRVMAIRSGYTPREVARALEGAGFACETQRHWVDAWDPERPDTLPPSEPPPTERTPLPATRAGARAGAILRALAEGGPSAPTEIARRLGVDKRTVARGLADLLAAGHVVRTGEGKGVRYEPVADALHDKVFGFDFDRMGGVP